VPFLPPESGGTGELSVNCPCSHPSESGNHVCLSLGVADASHGGFGVEGHFRATSRAWNSQLDIKEKDTGMRAIPIFAVALVTTGLAGCFTSETPLLTEANSVAPYGKISFREQSTQEVSTLTRAGTAYTIPSDDGSGPLTLRFAGTERPNWYVVQVSAPPSGTGLDLLYAVVRLDLQKREAAAFKAVTADSADNGPGLRPCNDLVCIEDIKAYAAMAMAYADKGGDPDATYEITVE
jgi:hypothetical protein